MKNETTSPKTEIPPLEEFELGLFIGELKRAAEHSIGADGISQLSGFQSLSEKDQLLVSQRAEQLRADQVLRSLENEWKRKSFDHLIVPKLRINSKAENKSITDFVRKFDADVVFHSVIRLASEKKWNTLETFLLNASTIGREGAHKQWRKSEGPSIWNTLWQIICDTIQLALVVCVLISVNHGFPAIVASLLILIYVNLSHQIESVSYFAPLLSKINR